MNQSKITIPSPHLCAFLLSALCLSACKDKPKETPTATDETKPAQAATAPPEAAPSNDASAPAAAQAEGTEAYALKMGASHVFRSDSMGSEPEAEWNGWKGIQRPRLWKAGEREVLLKFECTEEGDCELQASSGDKQLKALEVALNPAHSATLQYVAEGQQLTFVAHDSQDVGAYAAVRLKANEDGTLENRETLRLSASEMPEGSCLLDSNCGEDGTCFLIEPLKDSYCHGPEGDGE